MLAHSVNRLIYYADIIDSFSQFWANLGIKGCDLVAYFANRTKQIISEIISQIAHIWF